MDLLTTLTYLKNEKQIENQTNRKIKNSETDNNIKYRENELLEFCEFEGIICHF